MEDKQLDFNKPFLSVRRFSVPAEIPHFQEKGKSNNSVAKIPPLPVYRSELKSGPIRDPGTVPFVWEKSPGRPKDEEKLPIQAPEQPPATPKPPPGRSQNVKKKSLHRVSQSVRAGQKPKEHIQSSARSVSSMKKPGSSSDSMDDKGSTVSENGEETYVDALDSFSRTESFLNCSVSGLSGLDGQDLRSSERFFTDPQARDLMMGRFLPAAKAMASETPQHATRKQPVIHEKSRQPRHVRKALDQVSHHWHYQHRPVLSPYHALDTGKESEDDGCSESENPSIKVCGLLPRLRNSLCLLNPVHTTREQDMRPVSSACRVPARSPYLGFHRETRSKHVQYAEQRSGGDSQISVQPEDNFEMKRQSDQIYPRRDTKKLEGSSLYRHLHGNGIYPARSENVQSISPQEEHFHEMSVKTDNTVVNSFSSPGKQCINFRDLLASEGAEWEQGSTGPVVEKTVYVDSVQTSKPCISDSLDAEWIPLQKGDKFDAMGNNNNVKEAAVDSALQDTRLFDHKEERLKTKPETQQFIVLTTGAHNHNKEVGLLSSSGDIEELGLGTMIKTDSIDEKIDLEREILARSSNQENFHGGCPYFPVPPPLPKSPSESWLLRALPAVSSKNSSARSSFGTDVFNRIHASKSPPMDPKWEMIVKNSNVHQGHLRFPEEMLTPIPET